MNKQELKIKDEAIELVEKEVSKNKYKTTNLSIAARKTIIEQRNTNAFSIYYSYLRDNGCRIDKFDNPKLIN